MKQRLNLSFALIVTLLAWWTPARAGAPPEPPNILFLFADDFTYEALGALKLYDIDTPNLDRLAARGVTFTHTYIQGSWQPAVCVASRTTLVTGRSLWRAQALLPHLDEEVQQRRLLPQLLATHGYHTTFTGKWHIAADVKQVFDDTRHVRPGMPKDRPEAYNRPPANGRPDPWDPTDPTLGGYWEGGRHWTEITADDAIEALKAAPANPRPLFAYVAFNAPHDPRQAPAEYLDRYPLRRIQPLRNFLPLYPYAEAIASGPDLRDERLAPFPRTEAAIQLHRREYFALITHLDAQIGRILDTLAASGLESSTWILFTGDNGLSVGHHGLMGKQNMYEPALRVPLIIAGPSAPPGTHVDTPVYLQDLMPTLLDLAGCPIPDWVEFHSLLPELQGRAQARPPIYSAYLDRQRALLADGHKLIAYPEARTLRLYNLAADPDETRDLAADPASAPQRDRLFRLLLHRQHELDDPLDFTRAFPALIPTTESEPPP